MIFWNEGSFLNRYGTEEIGPDLLARDVAHRSMCDFRRFFALSDSNV